jgi:hypothetical protein
VKNDVGIKDAKQRTPLTVSLSGETLPRDLASFLVGVRAGCAALNPFSHHLACKDRWGFCVLKHREREKQGNDKNKMKIVTYNVNGLRSRISQFGSLHKLLTSFDADIICFQVLPLSLSRILWFQFWLTLTAQETKLRRQELTADLAMADGYESFFSCTRTSDKGRTGYSGKVFA